MSNTHIADNFVGRLKEIEIFEQWLDHSNPEAPWILFFYDALSDPDEKGGVGKTWLLQKCASIARQRQQLAIAMIDFFSVTHRNGAEIAWHIVESLRPIYSDWSPSTFDDAFRAYRLLLQDGEDISDALSQLYSAFTSDLSALEKQLTDTNKHLLVFFDTFERIEDNPVIAALNPLHPFPDNYNFRHIGVVIAGRNAPNLQHPNWKGRDAELQCVPLNPFSIDEMLQFVNEHGNLREELSADSLQVQTLYKRTQGRPIMLGLVTDVLRHSDLSLSRMLSTGSLNFQEYLVSRINELDRPINWIVLFMAHIYHRFNPDLFAWLLDNAIGVQNVVSDIDINRQDLWEQLLDLSFVRLSFSGDRNDVTLHDEMCRLVNMYNWPIQEASFGDFRKNLSRGVIEYYNRKIGVESPAGTHRVYTSEHQAFIVELLYHKLYVDRQEGLRFFEDHFRQASNLWLTAFARALLQEVKPFLNDFSAQWRSTLMLEEARLLSKEEDYDAAQALCRALEDQADAGWLEVHLADVLFERGENYRLASRYDEARYYLMRCLELEKVRGNRMRMRIATILGRIGYISMRQGELEDAAAYSEESLHILKSLGSVGRFGYSDILGTLSIINRLRGEYDDALRRSTLALNIRRDLYRKGKASELSIARTLSIVGVVYHKFADLEHALQCYNEALGIYEYHRYRAGIATIYNRLGQVELDKNNLPDALEWFRKAYNIAQRVDVETEINSLNKQGWTLARMNQLEQALTFLKTAVALARRVRDYYQEAESLLDLVNIYERLGQHDQSKQMYQEACDIVFKYKYYYPLGRAEYSRGDIHYGKGWFQEAFLHYGKYCYYMSLFNNTEFEKAVLKTMDRLNNVPQSDLQNIITSLRDYWSSLKMGKRESRLQNALDEAEILVMDL